MDIPWHHPNIHLKAKILVRDFLTKAVAVTVISFKVKKDLIIYTDSKYVKDGIESWIINWKKNGWKTSTKKIVKNKELWMQLDSLKNKHKITWKWVKGHAGFEFNEKADELARKYIESNI